MRWLARLVPFRLAMLAILFLLATGVALRVLPRFKSAFWGLSEMAHVAVGWAFLGVFLLYLVHHLARHWGSLKSGQRVLGLALTASTTHLLATGVALAIGRPGGFPSFLKDSHYVVTYLFSVLLLLHGTVGLRRRFASRMSRLFGDRS